MKNEEKEIIDWLKGNIGKEPSIRKEGVFHKVVNARKIEDLDFCDMPNKDVYINMINKRKIIITTSDLGYTVSYYKVITSCTPEDLKRINFNGSIPTHRSVSTSIKQLKEACEKEGYIFEIEEVLAEDITKIPEDLRGIKIDYEAHYGNY